MPGAQSFRETLEFGRYFYYIGRDGKPHRLNDEDVEDNPSLLIAGIKRHEENTMIKPLDDRVVVKQAEAEETTKGGIILAEVSKERPCIGTVLACGPGILHESGTFITMDINPGDKVLYSRYGGSDVNIAGEEYTVLRRADIIGWVND